MEVFTQWKHCQRETFLLEYPPGIFFISHLGKRKIIDSKVTFDRICDPSLEDNLLRFCPFALTWLDLQVLRVWIQLATTRSTDVDTKKKSLRSTPLTNIRVCVPYMHMYVYIYYIYTCIFDIPANPG